MFNDIYDQSKSKGSLMPGPQKGSQYEFADHLEALQDDPIGSLLALNDGLGLDDIGVRLDLMHELTSPPLDELSDGALKTIGTVSKLVTLFSRHGLLGPDQQGLWLTQPADNLWYADEKQPPLEILKLAAKPAGPTQDNIWRVCDAASTFLRPNTQGKSEMWNLIRGGSGGFSIPVHKH